MNWSWRSKAHDYVLWWLKSHHTAMTASESAQIALLFCVLFAIWNWAYLMQLVTCGLHQGTDRNTQRNWECEKRNIKVHSLSWIALSWSSPFEYLLHPFDAIQSTWMLFVPNQHRGRLPLMACLGTMDQTKTRVDLTTSCTLLIMFVIMHLHLVWCRFFIVTNSVNDCCWHFMVLWRVRWEKC